MSFERKALRKVLFSYRCWQLIGQDWVLGDTEEVREAFLLSEPLVRVRHEISNRDSWLFRSEVFDETRIVEGEPRYAVVPGTGEFADLDAVRAFYETYLRAKITEWVEQDLAAADVNG